MMMIMMMMMMMDLVCSYKTNLTSFSANWTCVKATTATRYHQFRWSCRSSASLSEPPTQWRDEYASLWRPLIAWWRTRSSTHEGSDTRLMRLREDGRLSTTVSGTTASRSLTLSSSSRTGKRSVHLSVLLSLSSWLPVTLGRLPLSIGVARIFSGGALFFFLPLVVALKTQAKTTKSTTPTVQISPVF